MVRKESRDDAGATRMDFDFAGGCTHLEAAQNARLVRVTADHNDWHAFVIIFPQLLAYLRKTSSESVACVKKQCDCSKLYTHIIS